jgi:tRNA-uridine 2-sulfurtransferase
MARVVLAMSGGVDSSVAAWLLKEQGHDVVGLFMRHGRRPEKGRPEKGRPEKGTGTFCAEHPPGRSGKRSQSPFPALPVGKQGCCSAADADDARRVAEMLGVPFYAVNFEREFERIVDYFADSYLAGRTPNPCIVCNTWLKFGRLFDYADSVGAEFVATGHHARMVPAPFPALCRGRDETKDQSYVLFGVRRELLGRLKLPVGEYRKEEIRCMAERLGLGVAEKPDSQEICFVPPGEHARFVRGRRPDCDTSGQIVTTDGAVVGRHGGIEQFTVGQRKGLGVALGEPRYVVRIEPESRRVVLGTHEELGRKELTADETNWLVDEPGGPIRCQVKIRYRSKLEEATVTPLAGSRFHVRFEEPRHGVAPGQAAVCYQGDRVLGGGWIE